MLEPLAEKIARSLHGKEPRGVETRVEGVGAFRQIFAQQMARHLARRRKEQVDGLFIDAGFIYATGSERDGDLLRATTSGTSIAASFSGGTLTLTPNAATKFS